jgi:hypothetical protein
MLDASREAATAVALWAPLLSAAPALKARVMASAAVLTDVGRARGARWWAAAAAALTAASVGIIAWNAALHIQIDGLEDRNSDLAAAAEQQGGRVAQLEEELVRARSVAENQDAVLTVISQPDVQLTKMTGTAMAPAATGRYVYSPSERLGAFDGSDLPPLPAGRVYQFWFIYETGWERAGVVDVGEDGRGRLVVNRSGTPSSGRGRPIGYAVTIEPTFGGEERTGGMVLRTPQE